MAMGIFKRAALLAATVATVKLTVVFGGLYVYGYNRPEPPGTFRYGSPAYDFVSDCFEMVGSSRDKAQHGHFAFCQCYATELQRRNIDEAEFPLLLRVIDGERPTVSAEENLSGAPQADVQLPVHLQHLVESTLPGCRKKSARFAEAERRFGENCRIVETLMRERSDVFEKHRVTPPPCGE